MQHDMIFLAEQRRRALLADAERERRVRQGRRADGHRWFHRNPAA